MQVISNIFLSEIFTQILKHITMHLQLQHLITINTLISMVLIQLLPNNIVTENSSTVIDHIPTNDNTHEIIPGIIQNDISDHYTIFCKIVTVQEHKTKSNMSIYFHRDKAKFGIEKYFDDMYENSKI